MRKLPGEHRRRTDIARLPSFYHIMQNFHRFSDRRFIIPAVDLIKVHKSVPNRRKL